MSFTAKAIIFDCDGVVVDSEPLIFQATKQVFRKYGVDLQRQDVLEGIGAGSKYVSDPREKYNLSRVSVEDLMKARSEAYQALADKDLRAKEDVLPFLRWLKDRAFLTGLASSSPNTMVRRSLSSAKVDPELFDKIVDGDSIQRKKPAPDVFLKASDLLGVPPKSCLVIEDAPPGIQAALAAGMKCVAITGSVPTERLSSADLVIDRFEELKVHLRQ